MKGLIIPASAGQPRGAEVNYDSDAWASKHMVAALGTKVLDSTSRINRSVLYPVPRFA